MLLFKACKSHPQELFQVCNAYISFLHLRLLKPRDPMSRDWLRINVGVGDRPRIPLKPSGPTEGATRESIAELLGPVPGLLVPLAVVWSLWSLPGFQLPRQLQ